jgi:hypothetical protein
MNEEYHRKDIGEVEADGLYADAHLSRAGGREDLRFLCRVVMRDDVESEKMRADQDVEPKRTGPTETEMWGMVITKIHRQFRAL